MLPSIKIQIKLNWKIHTQCAIMTTPCTIKSSDLTAITVTTRLNPTHTKPYKVRNTKPQVGLWILGRLKNIVTGVVGWTAWGIYGMWWFIVRDKAAYETTTACCLGGQNNAFSDIVLGHAKPPTPWSPGSVFCITHGKETWDLLICIFISY